MGLRGQVGEGYPDRKSRGGSETLTEARPRPALHDLGPAASLDVLSLPSWPGAERGSKSPSGFAPRVSETPL